MKIKFLLIFFLFSKAKVLKAQTNLPSSFCNCEDIYDLKTGNLSANSIMPFQVYLYLETKELNTTFLKRKCFAIVINENWLLSVASCFKDYDPKENRILVEIPYGGNNKFTYENIKDKPEVYTVEKIFTYPNYSEAEQSLDNKIFFNFAVLKLKTSFKDDIFLKKIKPACLLFGQKMIDKKKYFLVKKSSTCYQSTTNLNRKNLYYSSYEEYSFMLKHCHKDDVLCFYFDNLDTCSQDLGIPLYVKKGSKIYVVGIHIGYDFLKKKEIFYFACSQSKTYYFSYFHYVLPWIEKKVENKICRYSEENKKVRPKQKLKKLSKIEEKCECEYKELFDYIGNNSFFDPKKYTKRFNSPKKYFRHVVQIVEHKIYDVLAPYKFICTGVVINENFVITTAECAVELKLENLYIYFGKKNLEGIEKIDSFFFSYSSKILDQTYHPDHILYSDIFDNALQIFTTKLPIKERPDLLSPACFANEKELEKQENDKLLIASFMLLGDFENQVINLNKKSNIEFFISKYSKIDNDQSVNQCDSLICVLTPIYVQFDTEGSPLHRFTEYSMEVSGLMKKSGLPGARKLHRFVPLATNMQWIKSVVGQFDYCERNELNRYFDKKICKCDYPYLVEPVPFIATIVGYKNISSYTDANVCKSVIINDFWVLTTSACFKKSFVPEKYFLTLNDREFEKHTITELSKQKLTGKVYLIKQIIFNDKLGLALVKTKEKLFLGDYSNKFAGCFYSENKEIDFSRALVVESFTRNIQAIYDSKCNCIFINGEICLENEGTPISLIDDWADTAIVGLLSVHSIINKTSSFNCTLQTKKPYNFIPLQSSIEWLNQVVGKTRYCHLENYFFDPKKCSCQDRNVVSIVRKSLVGDITNYQHMCKGIIVNDFWVLTTATCVYKKTKILINTETNYNNNFYDALESNKNEFFINVTFIYMHPKFSEVSNKYGDFYDLQFNLALLRLQKPIGLKNLFNLEFSCFTEKKKYLSYNFLFSKITSQNNTVILWNEFKKESFIKKNFSRNSNVLSMKSSQIICDTDQGELIGTTSSLGVITVGLLSNLDDRYSMTKKKTCFNSIINIGLIANTKDTWFKDKVEAHGFCIYEKYHEFKLPNKCDCGVEGNIDPFYISQNFTKITNQKTIDEIPQFMFVVSISQSSLNFFEDFFELSPLTPLLSSYKFVNSAVVISPFYVLTAKSSAWQPFEFTGRQYTSLVGFNNDFFFTKILPEYYRVKLSYYFEPKKIIYFNDSQLVFIEIKPIQFSKLHSGLKKLVKVPCISFYNYEDFKEGKLIGVGYGSAKIYDIFDNEKMVLAKKIINELKYSPNSFEFITDLTEVSRRNPKADLTCEDKFICVTSNGTITEYDIGGPILFLKGQTMELVGIISLENNIIPGPYELFKFTRLSYMKKDISSVSNYNIGCAKNNS